MPINSYHIRFILYLDIRRESDFAAGAAVCIAAGAKPEVVERLLPVYDGRQIRDPSVYQLQHRCLRRPKHSQQCSASVHYRGVQASGHSLLHG